MPIVPMSLLNVRPATASLAVAYLAVMVLVSLPLLVAGSAAKLFRRAG